jgi:hypothetical protein
MWIAVTSMPLSRKAVGLRAAPWLRIGLAGQRTRTYGAGREFQRGMNASTPADPCCGDPSAQLLQALKAARRAGAVH